METDTTGMCHVCGKPGSIHLTEIDHGKKTNRSFCLEHVPAEMRDRLPFSPPRTPAEEVAFLREQVKVIDQRIADPAQRAEIKAGVEKLIAEIEAGRRRLGDAD